MYMDDNDMRTPRDRVNENFLRQLLNDNGRDSFSPLYDGTRRGGCGREGCKTDDAEPVFSYHSSCAKDDPSLAMVYSPIQHWRGLYDKDTGWRRGTIFKELDLPFFGDRMDDGKGGCGCE